LKALDDRERVEADDGYIGESPHITKCPCAVTAHPPELNKIRQRLRNRLETANERMKNFAILREEYHHDITKHGCVFCAVAVLYQLAIENGNPLFPVKNYFILSLFNRNGLKVVLCVIMYFYFLLTT
jgi:hypothetical protein